MSKSGRKPRVSDEEIIEVVREAGQPVLTTAEIADALPIGRRALHDRLVQLHESGKIVRKKVGPKGTVWYVE